MFKSVLFFHLRLNKQNENGIYFFTLLDEIIYHQFTFTLYFILIISNYAIYNIYYTATIPNRLKTTILQRNRRNV